VRSSCEPEQLNIAYPALICFQVGKQGIVLISNLLKQSLKVAILSAENSAPYGFAVTFLLPEIPV
jgi:hypothetical protein